MPSTRRTLLVASAALAVASLVAPGVAVAQPASPTPPAGRLLIGDSVSGMNTSALRARGFKVDYKVSRQFSHAPGILRAYGTRAPRNIVISLGTNGPISVSTCRDIVRAAGAQRRVFFVTNRVPRTYEASNNSTLRSCAGSFAYGRARVIDWWGLSDRHSSWFYGDGYHPRESSGAMEYARLIDGAVDAYGL